MLKATLIGNIGSDPELRYSADGKPVLRFSVASNGRTRNAEGVWVDQTTWVRVTTFGARAEGLSQHLSKGMRVCVMGKLEAKPWKNREGEPQSGLEVIADDIEFVGARSDAGGQDRPQSSQPSREQRRQVDESDDLEDLPF